MLEFVQRRDLISALTTDFNLATFTTMLLNRLDRKLENIVPAGLTFPETVGRVVVEADQQGWSWSLVEQALEANPGGPSLKKFIANHPNFDPAAGLKQNVDYVMANLLRGGRCFIGRKNLRVVLKEMTTGEKRVLVVTGDRVSGKTYTRWLIHFLSEKTPSQKAVYIDLDEAFYEARTLTERIGQLLGMDIATMPKQDDEQKSRWATRLCDWISAHVNNPGDITYWFVFDGFRDKTLLPEIKDWIDELAVQAESNMTQCRVVLLNYGDVLPWDINAYVGRETIAPIGPDELLDFFQKLNLEREKNYDSENLKSKVQVIIEQVDQAIAENPKNQRLRVLDLAVNETVRLHFA